MQAIPSTDPRRRRETLPLQGETPSPMDAPPGCAFSSRCPHVTADCRQAPPVLAPAPGSETAAGRVHQVACIRVDQIGRA
jgi:oligopeptide/dipeptide ABC transporter ATP-binding protein